MIHYMKMQSCLKALRVLYRRYTVGFVCVMGIMLTGCVTNGYYLDAPNVSCEEGKGPWNIESVTWGNELCNGYSDSSKDEKLLSECFYAPQIPVALNMRHIFGNRYSDNVYPAPLLGNDYGSMPVSVVVRCTTRAEKVLSRKEDKHHACTLYLWPASEEVKYEFSLEFVTPYTRMTRRFSIDHKAKASLIPLPYFSADTTEVVGADKHDRRPGFVRMPRGDGGRKTVSYRDGFAPQSLIKKGIENVFRDVKLKGESERYVAQMQKISSLRREGKWERVIEEAKSLSTQYAVSLKKEALDNIEARRVAAKVEEINALCERGEWNAVLASCEGEKGDKFDQFRKMAKVESERKRVEEKLARIRELEKKEEWSAVLLECKGESDPRIKDYAVIARPIVMKNASAALWSRFELLASGSKKRMQKEELWKKFFRGKRLLLKGVFDDADDAVVLKVGNGRVRLNLINEERPKVVNLEPGAETWFSGMLSDWDCGSTSVTMQYGRLGDENVRSGSSRSLGDIFSSSGGSDILSKAFMGGLMGEDAGGIFFDELIKSAVRTGVEVYNMSEEERDDIFDDAAEGLNGLGKVLDALFN